MNKGEIVDSFVDNRINEEENITGSVIKEGDKLNCCWFTKNKCKKWYNSKCKNEKNIFHKYS